jgi:hypothetical protein
VAQRGEADRLVQGAIARVGDARQHAGEFGLERASLHQHGGKAARGLRTQPGTGGRVHWWGLACARALR